MLSVGLPWPLWNRDVCLYGYGVDLLERDTVIVAVRSVHDNEFPEIPAVPNKHIRAECRVGGILAQPIAYNKTRVILLANADPKLAMVPYSLLNLVTKNLAHFAFSTFAHKAENLEGTEFQDRIDANPDMYGEVKARLDEYFKMKDLD
eukprot:TRINITY_DN6840_c0_g1_i1.p1 TRINITY_DN6840_c0_g1~~TRINITY_DN6840_c0_g1_i1.p1  ORF type:complete len:148 (-),score=38.58 TRINITY_DN6840_c0_g1_i1:69-512(-)